jgi:hypothetical protein
MQRDSRVVRIHRYADTMRHLEYAIRRAEQRHDYGLAESLRVERDYIRDQRSDLMREMWADDAQNKAAV